MLPPFGFVCIHRQPLADGAQREAEWLAQAAGGRAVAHLWQGAPGWVVPRRLTHLPAWPRAGARYGERLQVRASGGGLVPQGPGVWNLSLAWAAPGRGPADADATYRALCAALAAALARLDIHAAPQAVDGAFCDGRYNLAVRGRKLAGTAQAWRRIAAQPVVLAHAVLVVSADPAALTAQANELADTLGQGRPYRDEALTSVARERPSAPPAASASTPPAADCEAATLQALAEQFARVVPPRVAAATPTPNHQETGNGPA